jgi:APA family basic amino acid/polyamine antiporter
MDKKQGLSVKDLTILASGQVIGAGVVTLVGKAIGLTGHSVWLAYTAAILMGFCIIFPYIFLSSMIRVKGGNYTFVAAVLGDTFGGVYGMTFTLNALACGMFGLSLANYLNSILPGIPIKPTALAAITIFLIFNMFGIKFMSKVQNWMTVTLFLGLGIFIVMGLIHLKPGAFDFAAPDYFMGGTSGFLAAVMLLVYSCTGQAFVVSFSKEARNPRRDVPLSIIFSTVIILVIYCLIALVASSVLPIEEVAGKPLTDVAKSIMSKPLAYAFVIGGPIAALATTLNSSLAVFSRPFHQMCLDGWFPKSMGQMNRNGAPVRILLLMYVIAIVPIICDLNVSQIAGNVVLVGRIADVFAIVAVMLVPKKLPEAWNNRYIKVSSGVFLVLMTVSLISALGCIILTMNTIKPVQVILSLNYS